MKKLVLVLLSFVLSAFCLTTPTAFAATQDDILIKQSVEMLDDGGTLISSLYECANQPRGGKTGYASATYKNALGTVMWKVTVTGTFTYNGVTSSATDAEVSVSLYSDNVKFVSKNAYTSGASAIGTATVTYNASHTTRSATVSCDKNGNLY